MNQTTHEKLKDSDFWRAAVQAAIDDNQAGVMDVVEVTNRLVEVLESELTALRAQVAALTAECEAGAEFAKSVIEYFSGRGYADLPLREIDATFAKYQIARAARNAGEAGG